MQMNLFSFLKKKTSLSIVFDIREFTLSVAIVKIIKRQKPTIIYCHNFKIEEFEINVYRKYTESLIKAVDKALIEVKKTLQKIGNTEKIGGYYFFVGSPWVVSQSKEIKVSKDKPFEINDTFLKRIILSREEESLKELDGKNPLNWSVLEEKIIDSKLNGYKVNNLYKRKAREIEVHSFVSFIPKDLKEKFNSIIGCGISECPEHHTHSSTISSFTFLRDLFSDKNDFVYLDIGGKITDIYIVKEDIIHGIVSIPMGEDFILENIGKKTGQTKDIILSQLNMYFDGHCTDEDKGKISSSIKSGIDEWSNILKDAFLKICNEKETPRELLIIPNSNLTKIMSRIIKEDVDFTKKIFNKGLNVTSINESSMNAIISGGKIFRDEPFVKMNVIFIDKLSKEKRFYA